MSESTTWSPAFNPDRISTALTEVAPSLTWMRVAVARAVAGEPVILLADEPTGNLDSKSGESVMELLHELYMNGATICMVTHDPRYARHAERNIYLFDGRVVSEPVEEVAVEHIPRTRTGTRTLNPEPGTRNL